MNRPGTQEDLATIYDVPFLAHEDAHATRTATVQLNAVDQSLADNCEVGPTTRWLEVGVIGRDPLLVAQIHRPGGHPAAPRSIVVVGPAIPERERRVPDGEMERWPHVECGARHGKWTAAAVMGLIAKVEIVFQAVERGQHVRKRPARTAQLGPAVVVFGDPANGHHPIDRGTPAYTAA